MIIRLLLCLSFLACLSAKEPPFLENYDQAMEMAAKEKKILFIVFLGSDWCPWCQKMNREIFEDPDFLKETENLFIFLRLEYPRGQALPPDIQAQNERLKSLYRVSRFPTVVLVDPKKGEIARLGYLPGGGKAYAEELKSLLSDYNELKSALNAYHPKKWEEGFCLAKALGCSFYREKLMEKGLSSHPGAWFFLEKYREYVDQGKKDAEAAKEIRLEIQSRDPKNVRHSLFHLALIDFHTAVLRKEPAQKAALPLISYLREFPADREHAWKLQMMIAQFLFSRGLTELAIPYARASFKAAPPIVRKQLSDTISYMRKYVKEEKNIASESAGSLEKVETFEEK